MFVKCASNSTRKDVRLSEMIYVKTHIMNCTRFLNICYYISCIKFTFWFLKLLLSLCSHLFYKIFYLCNLSCWKIAATHVWIIEIFHYFCLIQFLAFLILGKFRLIIHPRLVVYCWHISISLVWDLKKYCNTSHVW